MAARIGIGKRLLANSRQLTVRRSRCQRARGCSAFTVQEKNRLIAHEIPRPWREHPIKRPASEIKRDALVDRRADLARQRDKVGDRAEMDVRRVVPGMRKALGHRHAAEEGDLGPNAPVAEIGHGNDGATANAQHVFEHDAGLARGLQRLRQDDIVESIVRVIDEICVGVALNYRQSLGDTIVDALLGELDSPPVDASLLGQEPQQFAVAAADVEHAGRGCDQFRHAQQVDARLSEGSSKAQSTPLARAAASMKPCVVSMNSGTSSRNASCPRSVSISTKDTEAPPALSARTIARESVVGNSQSEVNETTQNRVREPLKALARDPP